MFAASAMGSSDLPKSYATWDSSKKSSGVTLTNGNLTVSAPTYVGGSVAKGTIGKSTGKWYWEVTTVSGVQNAQLFGIGTLSAGYSSEASVAGYWGFYVCTGQVYNNGSAAAFSSAAAMGSVIGVALDLDNHTISYYKNGVLLGVGATGLPTQTYYPAWSNGATTTEFATANFGATPFAYSPPSGYNAGLYTQ